MRNKLLKRLLVLVMSGALVIGTCVPTLAQTTAAESAAESAETASDETAVLTGDTSDASTGDAAKADAADVSDDSSDVSYADTSVVTTGDSDDDSSVVTVTGGETISADGTYYLASDATGTITVAATEVTLIGDSSVTYSALAIDCTEEGTALTIQDLNISSTASNNIIDVTGSGNYLYLAGTNVLQRSSSTGYAVIHVDPSADLTIADAPDDDAEGVLYLYKSDMAAGIGGDTGEESGAITFADATIFAEGTKKGNLIGSGNGADETAGDITFTDGKYYLVSMAMGAVIGGGDVYVNGGTLTLNVNYGGAAISNSGTLTVTGGSIRTYIDPNAVSSWSSYGVTTYGVNDAAITAEKADGNGNAVSMYTIDTSALASADTYEVEVDGTIVYSGGLHAYSFIGETAETFDDSVITANWTASSDKNLYIYMTEEDHVVTVNGVSTNITWDDENEVFAACALSGISTGLGSVIVSDTKAEKGDTVTVTAEPDTGYYLAQVRYTYEDTDGEVTKVITETDGVYSFTMPADTAYVTADFISVTWDGTIDLTWYDPEATTYTISYAAQWAGVAALENGLFNNFPLYTDSNGNSVPNLTEDGLPYGYNESYYNTFTSDDGTTTIVGDITMLVVESSIGTTGSSNLVSSDDVYTGPEDYYGKTILLDADLDMGGSYSGDRTDLDNWTGPNYMPVSGQYCMQRGNGYTRISASFNGTFDGQGHVVYNIYCYRWEKVNYGNNQYIALIGAVDLSGTDGTYAAPSVQNVAVDGMIYGNRMVGGVVGGVGTCSGVNGDITDLPEISSCINFATVMNTDSKGCGGIVGMGSDGLTIKSCVNFGYIYTSYEYAGGICGQCECDVYNCYNFGYVGASNENYGSALGTNESGAVFTNCYYLKDSAVSTKYPAVRSIGSSSTVYEVEEADDFKEADIITDLCANTRDWVLDDADTIVSEEVQSRLESIYAYGSSLESYNGKGIAIPRGFINDTSTVTHITVTGTPVTEYDLFESFDVGDLQFVASYSDGTSEEITDYTITSETGGSVLTGADTYVTISFTRGGEEYSYKYEITVTDSTLESIAVTSEPDNMVYALGEYFDTAGLVITASFANGNTYDVTDYTYDKTDALTAEDTTVTFTYTYGEVTQTASLTITILPDEAPAVADDVVQLENESDMMWFSNQVTIGNMYDAVVCNAITVTSDGFEPIGMTGTTSASLPNYYTGTFDGQGYTITLALEDSSSYYTALFAGLAEGGVIRNLDLAGSVTAGGTAAALVARADGGEIENVTSSAAVSGKSSVGGIVGYAEDLTVTDCSNSGSVDASGNYSGGIAGYSVTSVLTGCANTGTITSSNMYCGGITGYASGSIVSCTNNGTVTSSGSNVGGIAGRMVTAGSVITSCMNYGAVTGGNYTGGVAGYLGAVITVSDCGNEGTVTGSTKTGYIGGVIGHAYTFAVTIDGCYNRGTLNATGYAGGILGYVKAAASITNCYNTGSVTGAGTYSYAGGIAAYAYYLTTVENCYSTGTVSYAGSNANDYSAAIAAYVSGSSNGLDTYSNNYGLEGSAANVIGYNTSYVTDTNAVFVSADTLKTYATIADGAESSVLGSAYKEDTVSINGGYPILLWEYHTYEAAWTWAEDYSTATLTLTCTDGDDTQTVEATVTSEVTTAATCTEDGVQTYTATATYNGVEYTDTQTAAIAATGHTYGLPAFTWADDCSSVTAAFTCSVCDDVQTVTVTDITSETTAATCTEAGLITHTATVIFEDTEHTATTSIVLAATGHDYDEGVVTTEATCTEDGVLTYTCKNDSSHTYTEAIPATGHSYVTVVTEPTCTEGGYTTYTCSVCGDTYTADETAAAGHSYEAVVTEPTCTEGGYTTYTCSVCGDTYTANETAATGHSYEAVVTEPTCTEGGYTTYTCSVCGDTYTADETEATGHSYGSDGYCTVCGDYSAEAAAATVIELIDAIGEVTTESGDAIAAARAAYDALLASDPDAAALVTNADTLTEAEETFEALTAEDDTSGGTTGGGTTEGGTTGGGTTEGGTTEGSSYTVPSSKIAAEKVSLTGATVAQVTQTLAKLTNDGDLADSTYYLLQAKAKKTTKKSVKLSWKKVDGAVSYVVYANACGKNKKLKMYKVTSKTSLNITKVAGKKLSSGKYYKFLVIALDADGKVIQTSKVIHTATRGGSVTNAKSVTLYKSGKKISSLTLTKGKSAKITAKVTKQDKKKKIKNHRKTKYESSNEKIATVNSKGKITAKAKGTCYIYAYAQNGVSRKIKVTVK